MMKKTFNGGWGQAREGEGEEEKRRAGRRREEKGREKRRGGEGEEKNYREQEGDEDKDAVIPLDTRMFLKTYRRHRRQNIVQQYPTMIPDIHHGPTYFLAHSADEFSVPAL